MSLTYFANCKNADRSPSMSCAEAVPRQSDMNSVNTTKNIISVVLSVLMMKESSLTEASVSRRGRRAHGDTKIQ